MARPQTVTTLPESPDVERHRRMIQYSIAMGIRVVCILLCFVVDGWWLVLPIAGAVLLPYFAVVIANAKSRRSERVLRPGSILRSSDLRSRDQGGH